MEDYEVNKSSSGNESELSDTESESLTELMKKLKKVQKSIAPSKLKKKEAKLEITRKMIADISKQKGDYDQRDALLRKEAENIERKLDFLMKPTRPHRPLQTRPIDDTSAVHKPKHSVTALDSANISEDILPEESIIESIETDISIKAEIMGSVNESINEDIYGVNESFSSLQGNANDSLLLDATVSRKPAKSIDEISSYKDLESIHSAQLLDTRIENNIATDIAYDDDFEELDSVSASFVSGKQQLMQILS
jgi:hypothetical protein